MTNCINTSEDADMAECEGEKVVTMMDVLQEQEKFEEDANAVLGASDDKNCTYLKGYIKRQAIYACLTCCVEAKSDSTKRAGVCLACSLNCHENHELIELYTRRNFRCDCGNPKFNSHPCQFIQNKTDLNEDNKYNQNFIGLYCTCHRPYPDPEAEAEEEMIQCTICEDWLHASHLEAILPSNDQYSEMICKSCMEMNEFLHDYSDLMVNVDAEVDVTINEITITEANKNEIVEKLPNTSVELLPPKEEMEVTEDISIKMENSVKNDLQKENRSNTKYFDKDSSVLSNGIYISPTAIESSNNTENEQVNCDGKQVASNSKDNAAVTNEPNEEILKSNKSSLNNDTICTSDDPNQLMETVEQNCEQGNTNHIQTDESVTSVSVPQAMSLYKNAENKAVHEIDQYKLGVNSTEDIDKNIKVPFVNKTDNFLIEESNTVNNDTLDNAENIVDIKNHTILPIDDQLKVTNINVISVIPENNKNDSFKINTNTTNEDVALKSIENIETKIESFQQIDEKTLKENYQNSGDQSDTLESATKDLLELTSDMVEEVLTEGKDKTTVDNERNSIDELSNTHFAVKSDEEKDKCTAIGESEEHLLLNGKNTANTYEVLHKNEELCKTHISDKKVKEKIADIEIDNVETKDVNSDRSIEHEKNKDVVTIEEMEENLLLNCEDTPSTQKELNKDEDLHKTRISVDEVKDKLNIEIDNVELKDSHSNEIIEREKDKNATKEETEENLLLNGDDTTSTQKGLNKDKDLSKTNIPVEKVQDDYVNIKIDNVENKKFNNSNDVFTTGKDKDIQTKNEHKRKLNETHESTTVKKLRLEERKCSRPKGVKRIYKGATFWPSDYRQKLCTCNECLTMYKDLKLLFLLDPEDTVTAYETLGKQNINGEPTTQYEKGLQALSSLDRIQQINAMTEFNKMRDKLLDFLKSFKDRNVIVKEEDIRAFFAGMKPRREPDGVYFCR